MVSAAAAFAVVGFTLIAAHALADHWVQRPEEAKHKGDPGWLGRLACAKHVTSYCFTAVVMLAPLVLLLDLPVTPTGVVLGQVVSGVSHYFADRRAPLHKLARLVGKGEFYQVGMHAEPHKRCLGTGAYALDQSWHTWWLWVATLVTVIAS